MVNKIWFRVDSTRYRRDFSVWPSTKTPHPECVYFHNLPSLYTQRNLSKILLNQTEIRLYLPISTWFRTKRTSDWFQINCKMVNIIWFQFDFIRSHKYFSVCRVSRTAICEALIAGHGEKTILQKMIILNCFFVILVQYMRHIQVYFN